MAEVIRISDQNELVPTAKYPYANWPFENFNPVQSRLFDTFQGESNVAIAASTSSGKTICSEMYAAYEIRKRKGKVIYIGPLRALAKEKEQDWRNPKHHFGDLKVSICTGDFRMTNNRIKEIDAADVIVMTPEMLASRCRNWKSEKSGFLKETGTIIFDESHLLTVPGRGDHIEVALMKMATINHDVRVVLLSATMPNVDEICGWVSNLTNRDTYFLESKYRPCPLGIHYEKYYDGDKTYEEKEEQKVGTALGIINYYPEDKFLVFVHTKRTGQMMLQHLKRYGHQAEFHNANLELKKRLELERKFKEDPGFRIIVSTSTLAWGLNLPARRVIVLGVDRGMSPVEVYDINQMVGRAGRPSYDPRGDAYILVPESKEKETIERLKKQPPIKSQMLEEVGGHYKTLAFHIVSEIHQGNVKTRDEFREWFRRSLAHHQAQKFSDVIIDKTIELLVKKRAVSVDERGNYTATPIGIVASMFYYSPFDVADLKFNWAKVFERGREKDDLCAAVALADIDSIRFGIVNKVEKLEMSRFAAKVKSMFSESAIPDASIKVAFAYHNMLSGHEVAAFSALQNTLRMDMDRTMEVVNALDSMAAKWGRLDYFHKLKMRLTYGVSEEMIPLCGIPQVGKVRAENLFKKGVKSLDQFIEVNTAMLSVIMGVSEAKANEIQKAAQTIKLKEML